MHPTLRMLLMDSTSLFGAGGTAGDMLGNEPSGVAFDFRSDRMLVRSASTPSLNFDGTIQQGIDASIISFTRATSASRTNGSGLIETVSSGLWRREYSPLTLSPLGYLPEPARTNLLLRSDAFDNASWTKTRSSIGADATTSPDGTANADRLIEDSTASNSHYVSQVITVSAGATITQTVYAKANSRSAIVLQMFNGSDQARASFNLATGAVGDTAVAGTASALVSSIHDVGGGWYRCRMTAIVSTTATAIECDVMMANAGSVAGRFYNGDGASNLYIFGADAQVGAYPTSYIPTTSATVTRNADVMTVALSKLPTIGTAMTLLAIAQKSSDATTNGHRLITIDNGTTGERAVIYNNTAGSSESAGLVTASSSSVAAIARAITGRHKTAWAVATNDFELVVNGVSAGTDTAGAFPASLSTLRFGSDTSGTNQYGAPIESFVLLPRRLSAAEMIARTA